MRRYAGLVIVVLAGLLGGLLVAPTPAQASSGPLRIMLEGDARQGSVASGLGPEDGRRLLRAWLNEMELGVDTAGLVASMQFSRPRAFPEASSAMSNQPPSRVKTSKSELAALTFTD